MDRTYYKENKYFVTGLTAIENGKEITNSDYRLYEEWDNTVFPLPLGVSVSSVAYSGAPKELVGFGRDWHTIHGLILKLRMLLGDEDDEMTRDMSTVQGALNSLRDLIKHWGLINMNNVLLKNNWVSIDGKSNEGAINDKPVLTFSRLWNNQRQLQIRSSYLKDIPLIKFDSNIDLIDGNNGTTPNVFGKYTLGELIKGRALSSNSTENDQYDDNGLNAYDGTTEIPKIPFISPWGGKENRLVKLDDHGNLVPINISSSDKNSLLPTGGASAVQNLGSDTQPWTKLYVKEIVGKGGDDGNEITISGNLTLSEGLSKKLTIGGNSSVVGTKGTSEEDIKYNGSEDITIAISKVFSSENAMRNTNGDFIGQIAFIVESN